jgi:hypothetical protein
MAFNSPNMRISVVINQQSFDSPNIFSIREPGETIIGGLLDELNNAIRRSVDVRIHFCIFHAPSRREGVQFGPMIQ